MPWFDENTDEEIIAEARPLGTIVGDSEMEKVLDNINKIQVCITHLGSGPLSYRLKQLYTAYILLITQYAPFKVGDTVLLSKTPYIDPDSGWYHCRHFLVSGSKATIKKIEVNVLKNDLSYDLEFENESFIDRNGDIIPIDLERRHTFCFGGTYFVKI